MLCKKRDAIKNKETGHAGHRARWTPGTLDTEHARHRARKPREAWLIRIRLVFSPAASVSFAFKKTGSKTCQPFEQSRTSECLTLLHESGRDLRPENGLDFQGRGCVARSRGQHTLKQGRCGRCVATLLMKR